MTSNQCLQSPSKKVERLTDPLALTPTGMRRT